VGPPLSGREYHLRVDCENRHRQSFAEARCLRIHTRLPIIRQYPLLDSVFEKVQHSYPRHGYSMNQRVSR
jgi:hypothetical protein